MYREFPGADFSRKIRGIVRSTRGLWALEACDQGCMASARTCSCFRVKMENYFLVRLKMRSESLPVLLFVILPGPVDGVGLPHVVGVLSDVLVPSVASRDLVLVVVVSEAVADLHARRSVEAVFKRISDHSEVGQPHPAGLDRARPRHPVALAFFAHLRLNVL